MERRKIGFREKCIYLEFKNNLKQNLGYMEIEMNSNNVLGVIMLSVTCLNLRHYWYIEQTRYLERDYSTGLISKEQYIKSNKWINQPFIKQLFTHPLQ